MIKIAVCGLGRMGSYHLSIYERLMDEGADIEIVAICDVEQIALDGKSKAIVNFVKTKASSRREHKKYLSLDELLKNEAPDIVDVVVPTYLHCECAVKVLNAGVNCLCEKPMALNEAECREMIQSAEKNKKLLMVGHCLRFWREYSWLYDRIKDKSLGELQGLYMTRGGFADHVNNPSWHDWIIDGEKGGGGLFDQHIHDTDFIRWALGEPERVYCFARKYFPNSRNDIVSTSYKYKSAVVTAIDDIAYRGLPFEYGFTANFEKAAVTYRDRVLTVWCDGKAGFTPDLSKYGDEDAYYNEIKYFIECVRTGAVPERCPVEDSMKTVILARAEEASALETK